MMSVKFRAKIGSAEVEFEGSEEFLKTELVNLVRQIGENASALPSAPRGVDAASAAGVGMNADHSTNTIASLIDARTGPDLALAASAHLSLVRGQDRFTRKELLAEMQGATTFYSQNYSGNLSKILGNLTRGKRLNLVGTNTYALPKAVRDEFVSRLAV